MHSNKIEFFRNGLLVFIIIGYSVGSASTHSESSNYKYHELGIRKAANKTGATSIISNQSISFFPQRKENYNTFPTVQSTCISIFNSDGMLLNQDSVKYNSEKNVEIEKSVSFDQSGTITDIREKNYEYDLLNRRVQTTGHWYNSNGTIQKDTLIEFKKNDTIGTYFKSYSNIPSSNEYYRAHLNLYDFKGYWVSTRDTFVDKNGAVLLAGNDVSRTYWSNEDSSIQLHESVVRTLYTDDVSKTKEWFYFNPQGYIVSQSDTSFNLSGQMIGFSNMLFSYNADGLKDTIIFSLFDSLGRIGTIYTFNGYGQQIKRVSFLYNGSDIERVISSITIMHKYSQTGKLLEEDVFNSDGNLFEKTCWSYDSENRIESEKTKKMTYELYKHQWPIGNKMYSLNGRQMYSDNNRRYANGIVILGANNEDRYWFSPMIK